MRRALALLAGLALTGAAGAAEDPRQCGAPTRYADGSIQRSASAKAAFARMYPCPVTGQVSGSCPGWAIDHVIPLALGGCDAPANMQWLPTVIKSCAGRSCKDRWERRVYAPRAAP